MIVAAVVCVRVFSFSCTWLCTILYFINIFVVVLVVATVGGAILSLSSGS